MPALQARHYEILNKAIQELNGYVFRVFGDAFAVAFHKPEEALNAALEAQRALYKETWTPAPVKVRMGIHTGTADWKGKDHEPEYEGYQTLALTSRIMSAGHGGQILLSQASCDLLSNNLPNGLALRDLGEHRLKDIIQHQRLFHVVVSDLPSDFAPLKTLAVFKHNLPAQLASFVGRENELQEATRILLHTRMLTLIGPGGTGKTRLSLQLAEEQLSNFNDGAWLIELAPLTEAAFITSTVANTFNLREVPGIPLLDILTDYLQGKQLLLLLDNCEHLVEACARLADHLLRACPRLKIVASSREALGVDGENVFRVPSLRSGEATQLFVERAAKAEPRFVLTEHNAPAIAKICSRLDSIPLAIELAAARVKIFTPEQIADRLDDRFKLLTGGSRTALPRQQTLRALIDWSYLTLNEMEQQALRRLAVFSGGWTFEAAEAVIGEVEALDGLTGLVNKSLVNVEEQQEASRYQFLETIRQYALEKLVEAGEASATRQGHLNYFAALAMKNRQAMRGVPAVIAVDEETRSLEWVSAIDKEYDNMRTALEWAIQNDPGRALDLLEILDFYWNVRDLNSEARTWCRVIIENPQAPELLRSRALGMLAYSLMVLGEMREVVLVASQSIEISRRLNDKQSLARSLSSLAMASVFTSGREEALQYAEESEAIAREAQFQAGIAAALGLKASVLLLSGGDPEEAKRCIEESLVISREFGFIWGIAVSGMGLGRLASRQGDLAGARREFMKSAELAERAGNRRIYASCYSELAHALRQHGQLDEAIELYKKVLPLWQDFGHRAAIAHEIECIGFIAIVRGQGERAARLIGAAEAIRQSINSSLNGIELAEYEQEVARLRLNVDETSLASWWSAGRAMTMEQAIDLVMNS
jgi:predicted ATPase